MQDRPAGRDCIELMGIVKAGTIQLAIVLHPWPCCLSESSVLAACLMNGCVACVCQVKHAFLRAAGRSQPDGDSPWGMDLTQAEIDSARQQPVVKLLTRKPVQASAEEAAANPRSRSAKLRIVQKL